MGFLRVPEETDPHGQRCSDAHKGAKCLGPALDHRLAKIRASRSDEAFSGFVTSLMTASVVVMARQRVVVLLAVLIDAAGTALVRAIGVAPGAATIIGVSSPLLTELTTSLAEF